MGSQRDMFSNMVPFYLFQLGTSDQDLINDVDHQCVAADGERIVAIVEKKILYEGTDICETVLIFFLLHYILDLQYHNSMKSTMEFLQKLIFKLGDEGISPKLLNLREKLAK